MAICVSAVAARPQAAGEKHVSRVSCPPNICAAACRPSEHSMPPVVAVAVAVVVVVVAAAAPLLLAPLWRYVCPSVAYKSEEPKDVG